MGATCVLLNSQRFDCQPLARVLDVNHFFESMVGMMKEKASPKMGLIFLAKARKVARWGLQPPRDAIRVYHISASVGFLIDIAVLVPGTEAGLEKEGSSED